jgi:hypothetical protein
MSYQVDFEKRGSFLYASVTGTNTADAVMGYMSEVRDRCAAEDCFRVLIDEKLDGPRFDEMEIFSLISAGSTDAVGFFEALAYVDQQQDFDLVKFAETVAVNRGIPVAVFNSVADAEDWLKGRNDDDNGQDIFTRDEA